MILTAVGCHSDDDRQSPANSNVAVGGSKVANSAATDERKNVLDKLREEGDSNRQGLPAGHPAIDDAQLPTGHPPIDETAPERADSLVTLRFDAPSEWKSRTPSSSMRKYEYGLSGVEGGEPAELVVYYFGRGQGGSVKDNLERWRNQFKTPDGKPVPAERVKQENFNAGELPVTMLEVGGEYLGMTMPGSPAPTSGKPNYRMIAAVIGTRNGPWFVKATGPDAAIAAERDRIVAFLRSAKP
jgi:hypothetical protein